MHSLPRDAAAVVGVERGEEGPELQRVKDGVEVEALDPLLQLAERERVGAVVVQRVEQLAHLVAACQ